MSLDGNGEEVAMLCDFPVDVVHYGAYIVIQRLQSLLAITFVTFKNPIKSDLFWSYA